MELQKAKQIATEKIAEHCPNYRFAFDDAKRRMGCCHYTERKITLSRHLVEINDEARVLNTIMHEIAHALTEGHHHDNVWKAKAIELGCNGNRCYTEENTQIIKGKFVYECPKCERNINRFRRIRRPISCGECCKKYNNNKYSPKYNFKRKYEVQK